ncbi:hypothetical protein E3J84_01650 [Candidatus Aerophobetes bacterium]|uniref:Uncharacterized protein n=1 Tax=Aerophobetes bacterium TaxID=2030807 RepID=A0A523S328_UNCAE|nr:MAG: hypothetical protein E3J84_01650 [Candidatus Aerophobetes bacterium]
MTPSSPARKKWNIGGQFCRFHVLLLDKDEVEEKNRCFKEKYLSSSPPTRGGASGDDFREVRGKKNSLDRSDGRKIIQTFNPKNGHSGLEVREVILLTK